MYVDAYAVIVQKNQDGGDTLQREGMYAFGKKLVYDEFKNEVHIQATSPRRPASLHLIDQFEVSPGIYRRHPDPTKWYSNADTTSRDQLIPVIAYCAAHQDHPRLFRLFNAVASRGFFAQNWIRIGDEKLQKKMPDPMHLTVPLFIRAGGWWTAPLYGVLHFYDSIELIGTLIEMLPLHFKDDHFVPRERSGNDADDNNVIIQHLLAAKFKPTFISEINRYLYSITREENFGTILLGETNPVMGALRWYHRSEYGGEGNPEIAELYRPLIEKYFTFETPHALVKKFLLKFFYDYEENGNLASRKQDLDIQLDITRSPYQHISNGQLPSSFYSLSFTRRLGFFEEAENSRTARIFAD